MSAAYDEKTINDVSQQFVQANKHAEEEQQFKQQTQSILRPFSGKSQNSTRYQQVENQAAKKSVSGKQN
jgi:hypothetical protein